MNKDDVFTRDQLVSIINSIYGFGRVNRNRHIASLEIIMRMRYDFAFSACRAVLGKRLTYYKMDPSWHIPEIKIPLDVKANRLYGIYCDEFRLDKLFEPEDYTYKTVIDEIIKADNEMYLRCMED